MSPWVQFLFTFFCNYVKQAAQLRPNNVGYTKKLYFFHHLAWNTSCRINYQLLLRKQAKTRWPQRWVDRVWMEDIFPQSPGVWADSDELELAAVIKRFRLEWVTAAWRVFFSLCTHGVRPRARNCLSKSKLLTEQSTWAGVDQYDLILFKRQKSWGGKNYISLSLQRKQYDVCHISAILQL